MIMFVEALELLKKNRSTKMYIAVLICYYLRLIYKSILQSVSHLLFITPMLWNRWPHCHFTDERTEAKRNEALEL